MPVDTSILAPQNGEPMGGMGPPAGEAPAPRKMGPGIIEGIKSAIQWLQKQGMEIEDIIQAVLRLAGEMGLDISEEQVVALAKQTEGMAPEGAAPGGMGPEGPPMME